MPRIRRLVPQEAAMHIICRGNNRQNIFNKEEDKARRAMVIPVICGRVGLRETSPFSSFSIGQFTGLLAREGKG